MRRRRTSRPPCSRRSRLAFASRRAADARSRAIGAISLRGPKPGRSRTADRAAQDLRRPGGDRDRERAPVQRDARRRSSSRPRPPRSSRSSAARRPTTQPVFDAIVQQRGAAVRRRDGRGRHARAATCCSSRRVRATERCRAPSSAATAIPARPETQYPAAAISTASAPRHRPTPMTDAGDVASAARRARVRGYRSVLAVPLMREGDGIGAIAVARAEPGAVHGQADRAAADLRRPGGDRDRERAPVQRDQGGARAADGDRGDSEGRSAARPPTCSRCSTRSSRSAAQLLPSARRRSCSRRRRDALVAARRAPTDEHDDCARVFPRPPDRDSRLGRASILERAARAVRRHRCADVPRRDPRKAARARQALRSVLGVPLLRGGRAHRRDRRARDPSRGPFTDKQIALLQTFADQAVIAIENVRLFKELQAQTEALTKSVGQLTALGEVGQAISSTLDLETVLKTIVSRARAAHRAGRRLDLRVRRAGARSSTCAPPRTCSEEIVEALRSTPIRKGDGAVGRTGVTREPTQIPDIRDESYQSAAPRAPRSAPATGRCWRCRCCARTSIVGALAVQRKAPGRVRARGRRAAQDLRHPVGAGDPERAPVPRDRGEGPAARGREPAQVPVPRQHEPRAEDAAERAPRLQRDAPGRHLRRGAGRHAPAARPDAVERQAPPAPDQQRARPRQDRGRAHGARARRVLGARHGGERALDPAAARGGQGTGLPRRGAGGHSPRVRRPRPHHAVPDEPRGQFAQVHQGRARSRSRWR